MTNDDVTYTETYTDPMHAIAVIRAARIMACDPTLSAAHHDAAVTAATEGERHLYVRWGQRLRTVAMAGGSLPALAILERAPSLIECCAQLPPLFG